MLRRHERACAGGVYSAIRVYLLILRFHHEADRAPDEGGSFYRAEKYHAPQSARVPELAESFRGDGRAENKHRLPVAGSG